MALWTVRRPVGRGATRRRVGVVFLLCAGVASGFWVTRDGVTTATGEGAVSHPDFVFEATVDASAVRDGTAPFDADDAPGNDADEHNGVVRTFDTVTYPVKITVNPTGAEPLKNVMVRLHGTLDNGVSAGRVNAGFAVGGYVRDGVVSFEQEFTIPQTGSAVMVPVTVEVQGARNGTVMRPRFTVEVTSLDGRDITDDGVKATFAALPSFRVSGKVNVKAEWSSLDYVRDGTLSAVIGGESDDMLYKRGVALGLGILPGKTDARGSTFPDGRITYDVRVTGLVDWDEAPDTALDFTGRDEPVGLFDNQPERDEENKVGYPGTEMDGVAYYHWPSYTNTANASIRDYMNPDNVTRWASNSVWDSGTYTVSPLVVTSGAVAFSGQVDGYFIGNTFPRYRTDTYTGHTRFSENDKIFSTNNFLFRTPNEYRTGGKNNPDGRANTVHYTVTFTLRDVSDGGVVTPIGKTYTTRITERNTLAGSFGTNNTFYGIDGRDLGYTHPGDPHASTGDPSVVLGEDVLFRSYVYYYTILYGGMRVLYRWNPDSFELTPAYAARAKTDIMNYGYANKDGTARIRNNTARQSVRFGVQKTPSTALTDLARYALDDYNWFDDYEAARATGDVAAIESDIRDVIGSDVYDVDIPLHVKTRRIGSLNEAGTPNMAWTTAYVYGDAARNVVYAPHVGRTVTRTTEYNADGEIVRLQSPVAFGVNFETLGVLNAELSSTLTPNKTTVYNSERVTWTAKNELLLPSLAALDAIDDGVTSTMTLPRGLDYVLESGRVGGVAVEPDVRLNADGTKTLTWAMLVSRTDGSLPDVSFQTSINPTALGTGASTSQTVSHTLASPLDTRSESLRTTSRTITILKVGMVGVYETLDKSHGKKDSAFTMTLAPFTTVEDERDVTGLTVLPATGDRYGSDFSGTARLSSLTVTGASARKYAGAVRVWLNDAVVDNSRPHQIDTSTGGWYAYTGGAQDVSRARTVLFRVDGLLAPTDTVRVNLRVQTAGNAFGDVYQSETVLNSATNYGLSPVSNRVRYQIRADAELALERLRVYTDTQDNGLPASVRVRLTVLDAPAIVGQDVTLGVYDKTTGVKLTETRLALTAISRENGLTIPVTGVDKGAHRDIEVRLEGFDADSVAVPDEAARIDTEGHVATERRLGTGDRDASGAIRFTGVVMTERRLGASIDRFYEHITVPAPPTPRVKAGYAFEVAPRVTYENDVLADVVSRLGIETTTPVAYSVDRRLIDDSLVYYDDSELVARIPLVADAPVETATSVNRTYRLPEVFLSRASGTLFTAEQVDAGLAPGVVVPAGRGVYVPTWIESANRYGVAVIGETPLGSHRMTFVQPGEVDVYAYMFAHADSETPVDDELLLEPMHKGDDPFDE